MFFNHNKQVPTLSSPVSVGPPPLSGRETMRTCPLAPRHWLRRTRAGGWHSGPLATRLLPRGALQPHPVGFPSACPSARGVWNRRLAGYERSDPSSLICTGLLVIVLIKVRWCWQQRACGGSASSLEQQRVGLCVTGRQRCV